VGGRVRSGGLVALATALGIAAIPAVSYSAGIRQRDGEYAAKPSKAAAEKHKKAKKCKRGNVKKNGNCMKRIPAPEALSATIAVHVIACGVAELSETCRPLETASLRITRLGSDGEDLSIETQNHTVHVTPGHYEVALVLPTVTEPKWVTVSKGQTLDVTLKIESI
jgi:hypothetical protein